MEPSQLWDILESGQLRVVGTLSLSTVVHKTWKEVETPIQQVLAIPLKGEEAKFPEGHSFFRQVSSFFSELSLNDGCISSPCIRVENVNWRDFFRKSFVRTLLNKKSKILVLLPEESFVEAFKNALPKRGADRVLTFSSDMPSSELVKLEQSLKSSQSIVIVGKRASNFLCLYSLFDEVIIFDPTNPHFQSQDYPRYNTLLNLYFYSMVTPMVLRLIPLTSTYPCYSADELHSTPKPVSGTSNERIIKLSRTIASQARSGVKMLVLNDALGIGQHIKCESCDSMVYCPNCGRYLLYSADTEHFACTNCGFRSRNVACQECQGRELSIQLVGVEGLAKLVRAELKKRNLPHTPRVGALYQARRGEIREANLGRTDVLIGTSTLFSPLSFYKPKKIVFILREFISVSQAPFVEEFVEDQIYRLYSLYGRNSVNIQLLGPKQITDAIFARIGPDRKKTLADIEKLKEDFKLPPFGVIINFSAYSTGKKELEKEVGKLLGEIEFIQSASMYEVSDVRLSSHSNRWVAHGKFLTSDVNYNHLLDFRASAKNKKVDIVFSPRYY